MRKPRKYYCSTYRQEFIFFHGWSDKQFTAYCEKYFNFTPNVSGHDGQTIIWEKDGILELWIWTRKKNIAHVVAHECLHAANILLKRIDWKPDLENDEPQAYLLTELVREFLR